RGDRAEARERRGVARRLHRALRGGRPPPPAVRGAAAGGAGQDREDSARPRRAARGHRAFRRGVSAPVTVGASLLDGEMDRVRVEIDSLLAEALSVPPDPRAQLYEAMRYAAIGGGKRLRPLFVLGACALFHIDRGR